jgi:hypothetical protein
VLLNPFAGPRSQFRSDEGKTTGQSDCSSRLSCRASRTPSSRHHRERPGSTASMRWRREIYRPRTPSFRLASRIRPSSRNIRLAQIALRVQTGASQDPRRPGDIRPILHTALPLSHDRSSPARRSLLSASTATGAGRKAIRSGRGQEPILLTNLLDWAVGLSGLSEPSRYRSGLRECRPSRSAGPFWRKWGVAPGAARVVLPAICDMPGSRTSRRTRGPAVGEGKGSSSASRSRPSRLPRQRTEATDGCARALFPARVQALQAGTDGRTERTDDRPRVGALAATARWSGPRPAESKQVGLALPRAAADARRSLGGSRPLRAPNSLPPGALWRAGSASFAL